MDQNDLYYIPGSWNVICDSCGKKIKASEAKQRWDGLIVCPLDFEMRQPQDFVKARADKITVPFTRPRPTDEFKLVCSLLTSSPNTDVAVTDCATLINTYSACLADYAGADIAIVNDASNLLCYSGIAITGLAITGNTNLNYTLPLTYYQQFELEMQTDYQDWQKQYCTPTTRTGIAGVGYAGCFTAGYNIQGYL